MIRDEQRRLRKHLADPAPEALLAELVVAYREAPIHRRLALLAFRVDLARGEAAGVVAGMEPPTVLDRAGAPIAATFDDLPAVDETLIEPPLRRFRIRFAAGATLALYTDGLPRDAHHPLAEAEVQRHVAKSAARPLATTVEELRALTLAKATAKVLTDDLFILLLRRA